MHGDHQRGKREAFESLFGLKGVTELLHKSLNKKSKKKKNAANGSD
jgi:hypothetical protein